MKYIYRSKRNNCLTLYYSSLSTIMGRRAKYQHEGSKNWRLGAMYAHC